MGTRTSARLLVHAHTNTQTHKHTYTHTYIRTHTMHGVADGVFIYPVGAREASVTRVTLHAAGVGSGEAEEGSFPSMDSVVKVDLQ